MNTPTPYLIGAGVAVLFILLLVIQHIWIKQHRSPDIARLKVLRGLFWAVILLATGRVALGAVSLMEGICVIGLLVSIRLSMRHYQKRLSSQ